MASEPIEYSHVGLCVSDLDRAVRFYCDGLGFSKAPTQEIGKRYAHVAEVPGANYTIMVIRKGGAGIELMHHHPPAPPFGKPAEHRNEMGLTHMAFRVDDVDATVKRLVEHGGTLLPETRLRDEKEHMLFLRDPDGNRILLLQKRKT